MAIMDYKTGIPGDEPSDLHRRQLCVYAAAGRREGMAVRAAYLMDLKHGTQFEVEVDPASLSSSEAWVGDTVLRLEGSDFPATPSKDACSYCDVAPICGQSRA